MEISNRSVAKRRRTDDVLKAENVNSGGRNDVSNQNNTGRYSGVENIMNKMRQILPHLSQEEDIQMKQILMIYEDKLKILEDALDQVKKKLKYEQEPTQEVDEMSSKLLSGVDLEKTETQMNDAKKLPQKFDEKPNHILLITVMNALYPITKDVIHAICSPVGKVLRIIVTKKQNVQAMVEFDSIKTAIKAREFLHDRDIFADCCTLNVEFCKLQSLKIFKNDSLTWDYTDHLSGKPLLGDRPVLLKNPSDGCAQNSSANGGECDNGNVNSLNQYESPPVHGSYGGCSPPKRFDQDPNYSSSQLPVKTHDIVCSSEGFLHQTGSNQKGCILRAFDLNHNKMNVNKLFNLMCLYGNVVKIKFWKSKQGCAMIQMSNDLSAKRAVSNLDGTVIFNSKLQLRHSNHHFFHDGQKPFKLPDGSSSFKDFSNSVNNRFSKTANKNKILPPSNMLHFFNAPLGISEDEMKKVFDAKKVNAPTRTKIYEAKFKKNSSGVLEFKSVSEALEGLVTCNHTEIFRPNDEHPYILKLNFSSMKTW